ncbi:vegetative incompatibility protein HET-E-1, putative [Rhizoctonia solani AG-3 Rhs1AP]|uniref:Vegetative incompatibility protein HET-E-1, putative n=1 Tax=Rhizoctonia solani AG-3 Rhs1AP TaxID=1086054 RepID=X8J247_9AGAM|nr:vegetative incompatibility protein HET-E-1, putative [Rhizoctonia solani AG-3 Rhs1AP]
MSSQYPPSDHKRQGIRKAMQTSLQWIKDAVRHPSSAPLPLTNPELLTAPNTASQNLLFSQPITLLLTPAPPPAELEVELWGDNSCPWTHDQLLSWILSWQPYRAQESDNAGLSRLAGALRAIKSSVKLFPPLKSVVGALTGSLDIVQQFEKLINEPMLNAKNAMPDSVVIVINALDECNDNYSVWLLLDLLLRFAEHLPLKFFVSSQPEPLIQERMMSQGGASRSVVYLHDIEESIVEEDTKKYLTESLRSMIPLPPPEEIKLLAKRSRNLFIYAATLVQYIYPKDVHVDSNSWLRSMLATISDCKAMAENKYEVLDQLYTTVLKAVFNKCLNNNEKRCMQDVLWTVVCAREPMTSATIVSLASLDEEQVLVALQALRSVVHVPKGRSLILTLHASFPEYMLDRSRLKRFHCDESNANKTLAFCCFNLMRSRLRFNICELESLYLTDDQVGNLDA